MMCENDLTIWTIGHSNRSLGEFIALLTDNAVEAVADVRRFPGSRKHPHFGQEALQSALLQAGIAYLSLPELGGRRRPRPNSRNTVWRSVSFRGYADYMETAEFRAGIERLMEVASRKRTAIMCAEAVWWRCHRALIADYLKSAGVCVRHIIENGKAEIHPYTSAARITEDGLSYSPAE